MPRTITLEASESQEQVLRHVLTLLHELEDLTDSATHGTVLDVVEDAVITRGREVQQQILARLVQRRIDAAEKKGRRSASAPAVGSRKTAAPATELF